MNQKSTETLERRIFAGRGARLLAVTTVTALAFAGLSAAPAAYAVPELATISGDALVGGGPMAPGTTITFMPTDPDLDPQVNNNAYGILGDGDYTVEDVVPGEYEVYIQGGDDTGYYTQFYGSNAVYGAKELVTINPGANVLDISVKYILGAGSEQPYISGGTTVGSTLTFHPSWDTPNVTSTIKWMVNHKAIAGQTGLTLTVPQSAIGGFIQAEETASKAGFYNQVTNADYTDIDGNYFSKVGKVSIPEYGVTVGQTLTPTISAWTPAADSLTYAWRVWGKDAVIATTKSYKVTSANFNKMVYVEVTAHKTGYFDSSEDSNPTEFVVNPKLVAAKPTVTGTLKQGATLTAKPGAWNQTGVAVSYQWFVNGYGSDYELPGATKSTYKVEPKWAGYKVFVKVTGKKSGFQNTELTSASTKAIPFLKVTAKTPTLSGTFKVGKTIKAKAGSWAPKGLQFYYIWSANGKPFAGSEKASLKLTKAQKGKKITVTVEGYKAGYAYTVKTSKASKKVK